MTDLLTVAEAARQLRRSPRYIRRLIGEGKLRGVRLGDRGHWLILHDSLRELVGFASEHRRSDAAREQRARQAGERLQFRPAP